MYNNVSLLPDNSLINQTLKVMYNAHDNRQDGDILMDVQEDSWESMQKATQTDNKRVWRARVNKMKLAAQRTTKPLRQWNLITTVAPREQDSS